MDKLQADKLTEIRSFHKDDEEFLRKYPTTRALQAHEHIIYLLQLVETQAQRIESLNEESMSNFRAAHERGKKVKKLRKALEWYADDRNYKLGNQTTLGQRAREALTQV